MSIAAGKFAMPRGIGRRRRGSWAATYPRRTKSFVQPALLLLLGRGEGHGYALIEGLKELGLADESLNPTVVYRGLREMEERGWVTSRWDTEGPGPSRRIYSITAGGRDFLRSWAAGLQEMKSTLERFLKTYESEEWGRQDHERA
jgi:PadR family transcriptional regulator PadR